MEHVAIVRERFARAMLEGTKTVECRLSTQRRAPFGSVSQGDTIYFRVAGGGYALRAMVGEVRSFDSLTPEGVATLRRTYDALVQGGHDFWHAKRGSRYATLVFLRDVRPIHAGPCTSRLPGYTPRSAWHVVRPGRARVA